MFIPQVFIKYKMPIEKKDFLDRYWQRRDQNLAQRWFIRKIVRWLRDLDLSGGNYVRDEDPFRSIFG